MLAVSFEFAFSICLSGSNEGLMHNGGHCCNAITLQSLRLKPQHTSRVRPVQDAAYLETCGTVVFTAVVETMGNANR